MARKNPNEPYQKKIGCQSVGQSRQTRVRFSLSTRLFHGALLKFLRVFELPTAPDGYNFFLFSLL